MTVGVVQRSLHADVSFMFSPQPLRFKALNFPRSLPSSSSSVSLFFFLFVSFLHLEELSNHGDKLFFSSTKQKEQSGGFGISPAADCNVLLLQLPGPRSKVRADLPFVNTLRRGARRSMMGSVDFSRGEGLAVKSRSMSAERAGVMQQRFD